MTRLLAALINGGLLASVLALLVWMVLKVVPRRLWNAATRYALWWAVLGITIVLPVLYLPQPPQARPSATAAGHPATPRPAVLVRDLAITPMRAVATEAAPRRPILSIEVAAAAWPRWIFAAWAVVSAFLLLRLALSCVLLYRTGRRAVDLPAELLARVPATTTRRLRLASSTDIATPVAIGPFRPSILIPAALLDRLDAAELEQIVAHEAGHLARYDDCSLLAQRTIEALFALHPVVRWIARRIDLEREIACDDLVIAATGRPRSYATCLTRVVEFGGRARPSLAAAGAADDASHLSRRIDMLLDKTRHTGTQLLKTRLVAVVAMVAVLAWIGGREGGFVAFAAPLVRTVRAIPQLIPLPAMAARVAEEPQEVGGAEFQGRVIDDSTGDALRSAEVRFHRAGMLELAADLDSDREGRIRATGLPEGHYTVEVSKPNYVTASLQFQVPGNALLVRLVRYGAIGGRVADQHGKPVPGTIRVPTGRAIGGARVVVLAKFEGAEQLHTVREGELADDGTYRFYDLMPGQYALGLWYDGIKEGSGVQLYPDNAHPRFFTVTGGEDYHDIDFMVLPQGTFRVAGKVELPKQGDRCALSLALPEQPALPIARTLTDNDGSFHFDRIPPGTYELLIGGPDKGFGAHTSALGPAPYFSRSHLSVSSNVENLVIVPAPAKSVTVTLRAAAGEALPKGCPPSVRISPEPLEPWAMTFPEPPMIAFGKEQIVKNLAPAKFRLRVMDLGSGCYQAKEAIADLTGDRAAAVAIELAAAGQIQGSLPAAARPADFVIVLLEDGESADAQTRLAFPDAKGHFAFDGLHPGRYRIAAQSAAESKARWVTGVAHMTAVEVKGGVATEVELPTPAKGDRQ